MRHTLAAIAVPSTTSPCDCGARRTSHAIACGTPGCDQATPRRPWLLPMLVACTMRSIRWRSPARGTAGGLGEWPDALSRTRILRRDRVGLPSEPGRGFFGISSSLRRVLTSPTASLARRAPRWSGRPEADPRHGRAARPDCESSAPMVELLREFLRGAARADQARSSGSETRVGTAGRLFGIVDPSPPGGKCPQDRSNSIPPAPPLGARHAYTCRVRKPGSRPETAA